MEASAYEEDSRSRGSFDLVVRLSTIEMNFACNINSIHVSGKIMIREEADGLSIEFVLKNEFPQGQTWYPSVPGGSDLERSPSLATCIRTWLPDAKFLYPEYWYTRGRDLI